MAKAKSVDNKPDTDADDILAQAGARDSNRLIDSLKLQLAKTKSLLDTAKSERDSAEQKLGLLVSLPHPATKIWKPYKHNHKADAATAVLMCSDWHCEETVKPERVMGLNEFNPDVCRQRVERLADRTIMLIEKQRSLAKIDELVVWLGGDFINGTIHEEYAENNAMGQVESVAFAEEMIASLLYSLRKNGKFSDIRVACSFGNHGRTTKKKRFSTGASNNLECLIYRHLDKLTSRDGFNWFIPDGEHLLTDIRGFLFRWQHGDLFKYGGGVGGLTIPVNKAIAKLNRGISVDYDCFGHWHQRFTGGHWFSNNCLVGFDEFAAGIAAEPSPPSQTLLIVANGYGVTSDEQVFLENPRQRVG